MWTCPSRLPFFFVAVLLLLLCHPASQLPSPTPTQTPRSPPQRRGTQRRDVQLGTKGRLIAAGCRLGRCAAVAADTEELLAG